MLRTTRHLLRARRARGWRLRAVAPWLLVLAVGLAIHYLLAANALLATSALRGGVGGPAEIFAVEYESATSLLPGVVDVKNLHIRAQDRNVQWTLDADRVRFTLGVLPLRRRVARLSGIRVTGVVFRIRLKIDPLDVTPEQTRLLAPIRGYADPPLREAGPPPPPVPPDELWTIELADVDARVREVWVQQIRGVGDGRLTSKQLTGLTVDSTEGLRVKFGGRDFALGHSTFVIRSASVRLGADEIAHHMRGRFVGSVDRFDLRRDLSSRLVRFVSARLWLHADVTRLAALGYYLRERPEVRLRGGDGSLDANLVLDHGVLRPGSRATARARELALSVGNVVLRTNATTRLTVPDRREAVASVRMARVRLSLRGSTGAPMWSDRVDLTARTTNLALPAGFGDATVSVTMPHARLPDLAALDAQLPAWLQMESGELRLDDVRASLSVARLTATASGRLEAEHFALSLDGSRVRGSARAEGRAGPISFDRRAARASGFVELREIRVGQSPKGAPLSGRFDVPSIEVDRRGVSFPVSFRLRDAGAVASAILDRLDLPLPSFVLDWLDHEDVHGSASLTTLPGVVAIERVDVRGDNYRLRGHLRLGREPPRGRVLVESGPLSVGVGLARGDTNIVLFGASKWFAGERARPQRLRRAGAGP